MITRKERLNKVKKEIYGVGILLPVNNDLNIIIFYSPTPPSKRKIEIDEDYIKYIPKKLFEKLERFGLPASSIKNLTSNYEILIDLDPSTFIKNKHGIQGIFILDKNNRPVTSTADIDSFLINYERWMNKLSQIIMLLDNKKDNLSLAEEANEFIKSYLCLKNNNINNIKKIINSFNTYYNKHSCSAPGIFFINILKHLLLTFKYPIKECRCCANFFIIGKKEKFYCSDECKNNYKSKSSYYKRKKASRQGKN